MLWALVAVCVSADADLEDQHLHPMYKSLERESKVVLEMRIAESTQQDETRLVAVADDTHGTLVLVNDEVLCVIELKFMNARLTAQPMMEEPKVKEVLKGTEENKANKEHAVAKEEITATTAAESKDHAVESKGKKEEIQAPKEKTSPKEKAARPCDLLNPSDCQPLTRPLPPPSPLMTRNRDMKR